MNNIQSSLSGTTKLLHIIIAFGMICMIAVGIYMSENEVLALYGIHKSFGAILFVLALFRVMWRVKKGWPTAVSEMGVWQHRIARAVHWILITATVLYPASGMMMSIGGGHGLATAYYLAKEHNITNVAIIEKGWIGGGNVGRNTTIIRSNYMHDDNALFSEFGMDLWRRMSQDLNYNVMFSPRGIINLAHSCLLYTSPSPRD